MKRKIFSLFLLIALILSVMAACTDDKTDGTDGEPQVVGNNYIFKEGSELTLVSSSTEISGEKKEAYGDLVYTLGVALDSSKSDITVNRAPDTATRAKREIIVGRCDREVSRQAYRELEALNLQGSDTAFIIYSNGTSVAIAYNEDDSYITPKEAIDYFIDTYITDKSSCVMKKGVEHSGVFSLTPFYQERDEAAVEEQWAELRAKISKEMYESVGSQSDKYADEIVAALKELYKMYSDNMVSWLANLIEPNICVCEGECQNTQYCGGAGFYYSNSGRDTEGFLPDVESTAQALGILINTGMLGLVGDDVKSAFSEELQAAFIRYAKAIQDPDTGYFYHPQWNKEEVGVARLGRDANYACSVLSYFGSAPTYNSPSGTSGDGILYDGTNLNAQEPVAPVAALTGRLLRSSSAAAISVVETIASVGYPSYMENDITYKAYLTTLDLATNSYSVGNQIAASASQLINRQKQLEANGITSYNLIDITAEWFKGKQNGKTGTWDFTDPNDDNYDPYYGNDGVLKISAWYNDVGRAFPNAALAAQNAINAILSDVDIEHVCNIYNTWFTISNLKINVTKYGNPKDATKFVNDLRLVAEDGIIKTRDKIADHQKVDGSFSYFKDHSSQTSQGMPVAVADTDEGDLNATSIATYGLVGYIFSALDFGDFRDHPDIFTDTDRRKFVEIVDELQAVIKRGEVDPSVPNTFDSYNPGDTIDTTKDKLFSIANGNRVTEENPIGTYFTMVKDTRPGVFGNYLEFHSEAKIDATDYISLMSTTGTGGNTWAFSIDMNFTEYIENACNQAGAHRTAAPGDAIYIGMGDGQAQNNVYMIVLRVREVDGEQVLGIWDASSMNSAAAVYNHIADVPMNQWFNLKVEYYRQKTETSESMRAKIYIDNKVVFVSDNYYDHQGDKISGTSSPTTTFNRVWISAVDRNTTTLLMDNFSVYKFRKNYTVEKLPIEKNVDGAGNSELIYDFESELPEEVELLSSAAVSDGKLVINNGGVYVPINIRSIKYNRASYQVDISVKGSVGDAGYILFTGNTYERDKIIQIGFRIVRSGGKLFVQLYEMPNGSTGADIEGARFPVDTLTEIRIDFFNKEDVALIYINGEFINQVAAKFGDVNKYVCGGVELVGKANQTVTVDNIIANHDTCDFTEAPGVKIDIPESTEDFEFDEGDAVLGGGAVIENGAVKLGAKDAYIILDYSKRSYIGQCNILAATISLADASVEGELVRLAMKDKDGNILFAVELVADKDYINVYEYAAGGRYPGVIAKGVKTEEFVIRIEYYSDVDKANIYAGGIGVTTTNISFDDDSSTREYAYAEITSIGIESTYINDITSDFLYVPFKTVGIVEETNPENKETLTTFDYAIDKNMPKTLTGVFRTYGAGISIRQMLKKINEVSEYSKVGKFTMSAGGNDELKFISAEDANTLKKASSTVFEGEFRIDSEYKGTLWQVVFGDSKKGLGNGAAYMLNLEINSENRVVIGEASSTNGNTRRDGNYYDVANVGEWFKLRVEYYPGNDDTVRIKVFINDSKTPLFVSDNYYRNYNVSGAPLNYFNQVNFYGQSKSYGTLYFDNIGFYANDGATCTDRVTETYTYGKDAKDEYKR